MGRLEKREEEEEGLKGEKMSLEEWEKRNVLEAEMVAIPPVFAYCCN